MSGTERRCVGGAVAFAFAAVWVSAGPLSALGCLLAGCAGFVFVTGLDRIGVTGRRVPIVETRARHRAPAPGQRSSDRRPRTTVAYKPEPVPATLVDAASYGW